METIKESKTKLRVHTGEISKRLPVFYNPEKKFDRDLSVIFARDTGVKSTLDLMCASGARGMRFLTEGGAEHVHFNDINPEGIKSARANLRANKISKEKYSVTKKEANLLCATIKEKFDFVDVDPFGSPINFISTAIRRVALGGYIAVTATDTAPLYGVFPKKCIKRYGSRPMRNVFGHETAMRILAKAIIELGAKQDIGLEPVLSHATKHYYRIYFRKTRGSKEIDNFGFLYFCSKCKHRFYENLKLKEFCPLCRERLNFAGFVYIGNLWDKQLLKKMSCFGKYDSYKTEDEWLHINSLKSVHRRFIDMLQGEAEINLPYFYEVGEFKFKAAPKMDFLLEALRKKGFKAARCHIHGDAFKTDANFKEIKKTIL